MHSEKSHKTPFIIYADPECLVERIGGRKNNPQNSSTTKVIRFFIVYNIVI